MPAIEISRMLFGLGAVAAVAAVALSFKKPLLSGLALLLSAMLAVAGWLPSILTTRSPAGANGLILLAAVVSCAALWALVLRGVPRNAHRIMAGGLALVLAIALLAAAPATNGGPRQTFLNLAQVAQLIAAGALVIGALWAAWPGATSRRQAARAISALALCWQSVGLLLYALGAQLAWGSYWRWSAWECWQLAAWTATGLLLVGSRELAWGKALTTAGVLLAAGMALLVLFGAPSLLGLLGQPIPAI
ncbi:MAG: hypothetical protein GX552_13535 [Chloroflexi bacterium]|nr:hypothetical protein [Chloroflexota bacterium]